MKILHTVSGIWKHTGGPAEVIPHLCRNLSALRNDVAIATLDGDLSDAALESEKDGVDICKFAVRLRMWPWYSNVMKSQLKELIRDADVVHGNGMWEYTNWRTGSEAIRQNKAYVISFHGSIMNPKRNWALKHKLIWRLLDSRYAKRAVCLHACTEEELKSIRKAGLTNPVAVIPNGVEIWPTLLDSTIHELIPAFSSKKTVLFLSRIHPSKGIFDLVNAWFSLDDISSDWQLLIAGPGQPKHVDRLKRLIASRKRESRIVCLGPLFKEKRIAVYQKCDVFVCPSYTENFGVVIGEALASGKPVIATHGVPWPDLTKHDCGWWVSNTVSALRDAICQAVQTGDDQLKEMGQRGKELVLKKYTWPTAAKQMLKTYEWILGSEKRPSWVDIY